MWRSLLGWIWVSEVRHLSLIIHLSLYCMKLRWKWKKHAAFYLFQLLGHISPCYILGLLTWHWNSSPLQHTLFRFLGTKKGLVHQFKYVYFHHIDISFQALLSLVYLCSSDIYKLINYVGFATWVTDRTCIYRICCTVLSSSHPSPLLKLRIMCILKRGISFLRAPLVLSISIKML